MRLILFFALGTIMGSYLNVWVDRIPKGKSIHYPPSHCVSCNHQLQWYDLIPILSYIQLKGKCRYCGTKYPSRQTIIELVTGLLFSLSYLHFGITSYLVLYDTFIVFLIALSLIDLDTMILPSKMIYCSAIIALFIKLYQCYEQQSFSIIIQSFDSALSVCFFWMIMFYVTKKIFKKECIGIGDIRLFTLVAFFVPHSGYIINSLGTTAFTAFIFTLYRFAKKDPPVIFPFGPFITIGAIINLIML